MNNRREDEVDTANRYVLSPHVHFMCSLHDSFVERCQLTIRNLDIALAIGNGLILRRALQSECVHCLGGSPLDWRA